MEKTIIYLIRHAETVKEDGIRNTDESSQMINEKEILSVEGEKAAEKLSKHFELKDIDILWSSSYTRAKATAKYIAFQNNIDMNYDYRLSERKLGNLTEIAEFMKDKKTRDPSQEQLIYRTFKTSDGESCEDTNRRMTDFLNEILDKYKGKKVAIVSHGGSIKFLLLNWCKVNESVKLEFNSKELDITSPCLLKLIFEGDNLINIEQIKDI